MLELKYSFLFSGSSCSGSYNRTMLELKFDAIEFKNGKAETYNRTMLELKYVVKDADGSNGSLIIVQCLN